MYETTGNPLLVFVILTKIKP